MRHATLALLLLSLSGCVSSQVQRGALYGAIAGTAVGAGGGWAISDPKLGGTEPDPLHGDTELSVGTSIATGAAIGLVVGGIVGAMVGHQRETPYERTPPPKPPGSPPAAAAAARAPYTL